MRGRKPKPTALKLLTGNPGKRKLPRGEPKPSGVATCPSHLDAGARREWYRLCGVLKPLQLATEADRGALAAYCVAYSRWVTAERELVELGPIIKSPADYPIVNPWLSVANKAMEQMKALGSEFGLTPASRTRIRTPEPQKPLEDEADAYFGAA